jgi:tetratricopeptide (TPR) repeat protein
MENVLPIDSQNAIVRYCAEGIQREQSGERDEALRLFTLAWDKSTDAFERTIAAHYLARHQTTPEEVLHWNQEALRNADTVGDDRVREFYPSHYLNLGKAHEDLGNTNDARRFYALAAERVDCLPESPYSVIVRRGVMDGLHRTEPSVKESDAGSAVRCFS